MANLDDLNYQSITEMTTEESLELIRQIRLSRRTVVRTPKQQTAITKKQKAKAIPTMDANQAAELLKLLTGGK